MEYSGLSGISSLTLRQFALAISRAVNSNPELRQQWVVAELSDFRMHGPHAYGQLIEKDPTGRTVAKMQATIWARELAAIQAKFKSVTGQSIRTGMKVLLRLTALHSELYGLSANVTDIDPSYTLGDLERLRQEILNKLRIEGIYEANKSKTLSSAPQRIAVISAEGAAGYGDFMNQLNSRGFAFYPLLYQANMQGDRTVPSILRALDSIEMTEEFWDCVVIIRGGGATSDLNSFDNLELARRIATFPLPVIVGIGHERDNTVLDYIVHTRCKTPTAVAAFLNDRLAASEEHAEELMHKVINITRNALSAESRRLAHSAAMLPVVVPAKIAEESHRLDRLHVAVSNTATSGINREKMRLKEYAVTLARTCSTSISSRMGRLESIPDLLNQLTGNRLLIEKNRLESTSKMIEVLGPEATLRRGYSITRFNGKAIRNAREIPPGSQIESILADGTIISETIAQK